MDASSSLPKDTVAKSEMDVSFLAQHGLNRALRYRDKTGRLILLYRLFQCITYLQQKGINTILSIGSGNGLLEAILVKKFQGLQIICVDPDPTSFCPIPSSFFTMNGLTEQIPLFKEGLKIVSTDVIADKFAVMFNWWSPTDGDIDILIHLIKTFETRLQAVISVSELTGGTNSESWLNWLTDDSPLRNPLTDWRIQSDHITQGEKHVEITFRGMTTNYYVYAVVLTLFSYWCKPIKHSVFLPPTGVMSSSSSSETGDNN